MKKCPFCGSNCFDDMTMCYVCLHRFDSPEESIEEKALRERGEENVPALAQQSVQLPPEESVQLPVVQPVKEPLQEPSAMPVSEQMAAPIRPQVEATPCIRIEIPLKVLTSLSKAVTA